MTIEKCGGESSPRVEERIGADRRLCSPKAFSKYWLYGRRKTIRRGSDRRRHIRLDNHSTKLFSIIMLTLFLSLMDASLTLFLIGKGAVEINPVMDFYLQKGPSVFVGVKYGLTCAAIIVLLLLKHMKIGNSRLKVRSVLCLTPLPFYLVIQWQFFLLHLL